MGKEVSNRSCKELNAYLISPVPYPHNAALFEAINGK